MGKNFFQLKQVVAEHKISFAISCACVILVALILFCLVFFVLNISSDPSVPSEVPKETVGESVVNSALTKEVRGVYIASVHNINFPSSAGKSADALKAELDAIINKCVETGFNTIYFQVRPSATALGCICHRRNRSLRRPVSYQMLYTVRQDKALQLC